VADLYAQLEASGYLGGRIRVLHDLTDAELATLYRGCLFTLFPSFVEGWGLPVGESLSYGKPCIASDASAIPEVGGALVDYLDPHNLRSGVAAVRRFLQDRPALAARQAEIERDFRPRGWAAVGEEFFAASRRLMAAPPRPAPLPRLAQGVLFRPASLVQREVAPALDQPLRLVLAAGWQAPTAQGAYASPKAEATRLRFATDAAPGSALQVFLWLRLEEVGKAEALLLRPVHGAALRVPLGPRPGLAGPGRNLKLRLPLLADAEGVVALSLSLERPPGSRPAKRPTRLLLQALGHAGAENLAARLELVEAMLLDEHG
jgi:hypothetical protein